MPYDRSKVGVLLPPGDAVCFDAEPDDRSGFVCRGLAATGLDFVVIREADELEREEPDVLIVAYAGSGCSHTSERLWEFVLRGGTLIAYAGLNEFADRLGCSIEERQEPGYALLPRFAGGPQELRYERAVVWRFDRRPLLETRAELELLGVIRTDSQDGRPLGAAIHRFSIGRGAIHRWAAGLPAVWREPGEDAAADGWQEAAARDWLLLAGTRSPRLEPVSGRALGGSYLAKMEIEAYTGL